MRISTVSLEKTADFNGTMQPLPHETCLPAHGTSVVEKCHSRNRVSVLIGILQEEADKEC